MKLLLYSFIITHGYSDVLYFNNIWYNTLCYILTIFNIRLLYNLYPALCIFATLFMSIIHFSYDFDYVVNNSNYIYAVFLGLLYTKDQMIYWLYILTYTNIEIKYLKNIITSIRYICMINSILFFINNTIISSIDYILIIIMSQLLNPLSTIILYLGVVHTPLAISRLPYTPNLNIFNIYLILMFVHIVVLIVGKDLIKKNIPIIVSILNTHILFHLIR